jgi:hypothetical protein
MVIAYHQGFRLISRIEILISRWSKVLIILLSCLLSLLLLCLVLLVCWEIFSPIILLLKGLVLLVSESVLFGTFVSSGNILCLFLWVLGLSIWNILHVLISYKALFAKWDLFKKFLRFITNICFPIREQSRENYLLCISLFTVDSFSSLSFKMFSYMILESCFFPLGYYGYLK